MNDSRYAQSGALLKDGYARVAAAPAVLAGAWLVLAVTALPFALALGGTIEGDLGSSTAADSAARGVNFEWWQEFGFRHPEHAGSFRPSIIGGAAPLGNASAWLDNVPTAAPIGAAIAYLAAWAFLLGGTLDRYARRRRLGTAAFFAACGVFFWRFLRLGVLAAAAYVIVFGGLHHWLFGLFYPWVTRDLDVERTAFAWRVALYVAFLVPLGAAMLLFDYAKVRLVVEDRRSAIGALVAAARFIRRHPAGAAGLFSANTFLYAAVTLAYVAFAPGARHDAVGGAFLTLAAGQVYVLARLAVKLGSYATAVAFFEDRLAHRGYTAPPEPVWPDSPAAEAIASGAGAPPPARGGAPAAPGL
jgi:hypothetical protein